MAGTEGSRGLASLLSKISGLLSFGGGSAIGLSIGSSSIKVIELSRAGKSWKLDSWGMVELPEGALDQREIVNSIAVVEGIKRLTSEVKLRSKNVCTAISGSSVMMRRLPLEVPNQKELEEQVFWEAEQYHHFGANDVVMDFQVLSRSKDGQTDVMLVAAKKSTVEGYIEAVADSGLEAKIVDADFFALQNAFEANYGSPQGESVALVDVGASGTKVVIVQDGIPLYNKDIAMGGQSLTTEIKAQTGHSFADAESLKVSNGMGVPQEVLDIMRLSNENLATEIKRALDYFEGTTPGARTGVVYLSGGGALVPGLPGIVEEVTGRTTQFLNPFAGITADPARFTEEDLKSIAPFAVVPLGLALRAGAGP